MLEPCDTCVYENKLGSQEPCVSCNRHNDKYVCAIQSAYDEEEEKEQVVEGSAKSSTHYQQGSMQPIEIMQDHMTREELIGFLKGNVIKYIMRCGHKDAPEKELSKVIQYATWLRQVHTGKKINPRD